MILELTPLSMAEAKVFLTDREDTKVVSDYLEKFTKISKDKAIKLADDLRGLKNIKLKETHVVKMADFLPRDAEEVHKIANDVSLTEQEVLEILDVVKNY